MDYKNENLHNEQGSMQEETDKKNARNQTAEQQGEKPLAIIPSTEIAGSDADKDNDGQASIEDYEAKEKDDFEDDVRIKRSSWNSITFDTDDFFSGLVPA